MLLLGNLQAEQVKRAEALAKALPIGERSACSTVWTSTIAALRPTLGLGSPPEEPCSPSQWTRASATGSARRSRRRTHCLLLEHARPPLFPRPRGWLLRCQVWGRRRAPAPLLHSALLQGRRASGTRRPPTTSAASREIASLAPAPCRPEVRPERRGGARRGAVTLRRRRLGAGSHGGRARGAVHPGALRRVGARPSSAPRAASPRRRTKRRVGCALRPSSGWASAEVVGGRPPSSGLLAALRGLEPRRRQAGRACSSSSTGVRVGAWPRPRPPKRSPALVLLGAVPTRRLFQGLVPHRPPGSRPKFVNSVMTPHVWGVRAPTL